ncbi:MAG: hypothetical protein KGN78_04825 [Actinomycetales bacterium]|nr:hypothetical protein [Actinomycetales bacterium]
MDPTSPEYQRRLAALRSQVGGPQTGTAFAGAERETFGALGASKGVGAEQAALADALRAQAEGRGLSLAQLQYRQALEGAQAAAASQLASARGLSPAQAQRLMLQQQAGMRAQAASQSAQLRLQEQMAAQAALGNLLGQRRQQELLGGQLAAGLYGTAGGLGTQQAISQAELNQRAQQMAMGLGQQEQARETQAAGSLTGAGAAFGQTLIQAGRRSGDAGTTPAVAPATTPARARGGDAPREVPGKAKFKGDTRSNDTVPALLSPGEIVLPRSVAQAPDAPEKSKKFVEAIKKQKRPSPKAYAQALARLAELESRMDAMEALADLEAEEEG